MKVGVSNSQLLQQAANSSQTGLVKHSQQVENSQPSFMQRLEDGLEQVAQTQNDAANLAKNYELGLENDLAKVMVGQQVSSLAFQLTLNVRNKALSAYKDIMNMPV
ncbi:MAG: flagellar hook-basal body complex protein FliE [Rhodobacterales bacterium]|nr:flagellar hook-basal body complex protein FliE [Rhodobacterales bacterium]